LSARSHSADATRGWSLPCARTRVPLSASALGGLDALLSTVQMPPGVPVATVAVDGTQNAAHLAARILALKHPGIGERIESYLREQKKRYDEWKS